MNGISKYEYFVGVDLGFRLSWWKKLLVRFGIVRRSRFQDYSCLTVFKRKSDGTLEVVDINLFDL